MIAKEKIINDLSIIIKVLDTTKEAMTTKDICTATGLAISRIRNVFSDAKSDRYASDDDISKLLSRITVTKIKHRCSYQINNLDVERYSGIRNDEGYPDPTAASVIIEKKETTTDEDRRIPVPGEFWQYSIGGKPMTGFVVNQTGNSVILCPANSYDFEEGVGIFGKNRKWTVRTDRVVRKNILSMDECVDEILNAKGVPVKLNEVRTAIARNIGYRPEKVEPKIVEKIVEKPVMAAVTNFDIDALRQELEHVKTERDIYKNLLTGLIRN